MTKELRVLGLSALICKCFATPQQGVHYRMLLNGAWATGANAPPHTEATLRHIVGVPNHVRWDMA